LGGSQSRKGKNLKKAKLLKQEIAKLLTIIRESELMNKEKVDSEIKK
jgi:hypothetical protein